MGICTTREDRSDDTGGVMTIDRLVRKWYFFLAVILCYFGTIAFVSWFLCGTVNATDLVTLKDYKTSFYTATGNTNQIDSVVTRLVNAGIAAVTSESGCFQKFDTLITSDGNSDYALNTDCQSNGVVSVVLKQAGMRSGLIHVLPSDIGKMGTKTGCPQLWYMYGNELAGAYVTVYPEGSAWACTLIVCYAAAAPYRTDDSMNVQIPRRLGWYAVEAAKFEYQRAYEIQVDAQEVANWQAAMMRERARYVPQVDVRE